MYVPCSTVLTANFLSRPIEEIPAHVAEAGIAAILCAMHETDKEKRTTQPQYDRGYLAAIMRASKSQEDYWADWDNEKTIEEIRRQIAYLFT